MPQKQIKDQDNESRAGFREDLYRARELRGDWAFGEEILDIADNVNDDWSYNPRAAS
jgi:hypothetical protein